MKITAYDKLKLEHSAVALGKFEGLHKGHMLLLDKIAALSNENKFASVVLTVNVPSDKVIHIPRERFSILEHAGIQIAAECEFSSEFAKMSPEDFVKKILVDRLGAKYVVVGEDFRFGCKRSGDVNTLRRLGEKLGFSVIAFEKLMIDNITVSSSLIRTLIEQGDMERVSLYMGREYSISGTVTRGKMLGRELGFPTANIIPAKDKLLPADGVYCSSVCIDNVIYKAITNIGQNPTTDTDKVTRVETHIINYSGDLYGRDLTVSIKSFLRGEIKFNSINELKNQLEKDKQKAMHQ
ncbi:MAG: bifunctional riboflavin kinase/FAD synthetase [Clostridium sp.]|nr:bifunctional riboflavin kinase/FAD synthetase [Clostridium sp.]MCM1172637.1 bifunctional riboflavin kinase/FAD synthetase [Clostridium sp.]MCM1209000.1 bifunctional riboflavin kinase/FAD synthetase [Ruminococcus sp.]